MSVGSAGMHSVSAAWSLNGSLVPLAGKSFNPSAAVRVNAPANTDKNGFTANLRGTANSQLTVELNGKPYTTVITNSAGSARLNVEIPADIRSGSTLTLRAYDKSSSDETTVNYAVNDATLLISLSASYSMGNVSFVKNGIRIKKPNYPCPNNDGIDWWTVSAVLEGKADSLDTENVSAQIMLENGDFRTVDMKLTHCSIADGKQVSTLKGMYRQNGYKSVSKPVNISLFYRDKAETFSPDTNNRMDYEQFSPELQDFNDKLDELNAETEQAILTV